MAEGTLSDIPDDQQVWLAVQVGNLLYPKERGIPAGDEHWLRQSIEAGEPPGGKFSVVLLRVGPEGQRQIEGWLARGERGGGFPGLPAIADSTELDAATDLVLSAAFAPPATEATPPRGDIVSPGDGERLPSVFDVRGTLTDIPEDRHVWLAVRVKNLLYPKEPAIPARDGSWVQEGVAPGIAVGQGFSVVLLVVGPDGQGQIEGWLARGKRGKGFPGLRAITESSELDVVRDVVVR